MRSSLEARPGHDEFRVQKQFGAHTDKVIQDKRQAGLVHLSELLGRDALPSVCIMVSCGGVYTKFYFHTSRDVSLGRAQYRSSLGKGAAASGLSAIDLRHQ